MSFDRELAKETLIHSAPTVKIGLYVEKLEWIVMSSTKEDHLFGEEI